MRRIDLSGKQFGDITVTKSIGSFTDTKGKKTLIWAGQCRCGAYVAVRANNLQSGNTKSCGDCNRSIRHFVHGHRHSPEYGIYYAARNRCENPKNPRFPRYGARGIKFLFKNFPEFMECIGPRPDGLVLDRTDNDGNYEVGNVRWVTRSQSVLNSTKCLKSGE